MKNKRQRAANSSEELYEYAVRALARKMRTVAELKRLMRPRVPNGQELWIEAVVAKLKEHGYLNDTQYAVAFTRMRQENQRFGKRRVQQDLIAKGVHAEVIAKTLDVSYEGKDEAAMARQYLDRKRVAKPKDDKETARVMRMLMRAGYSSSAIWKALKAWKIEVPEEGSEDIEEPSAST